MALAFIERKRQVAGVRVLYLMKWEHRSQQGRGQALTHQRRNQGSSLLTEHCSSLVKNDLLMLWLSNACSIVFRRAFLFQSRRADSSSLLFKKFLLCWTINQNVQRLFNLFFALMAKKAETMFLWRLKLSFKFIAERMRVRFAFSDYSCYYKRSRVYLLAVLIRLKASFLQAQISFGYKSEKASCRSCLSSLNFALAFCATIFVSRNALSILKVQRSASLTDARQIDSTLLHTINGYCRCCLIFYQIRRETCQRGLDMLSAFRTAPWLAQFSHLSRRAREADQKLLCFYTNRIAPAQRQLARGELIWGEPSSTSPTISFRKTGKGQCHLPCFRPFSYCCCRRSSRQGASTMRERRLRTARAFSWAGTWRQSRVSRCSSMLSINKFADLLIQQMQSLFDNILRQNPAEWTVLLIERAALLALNLLDLLYLAPPQAQAAILSEVIARPSVFLNWLVQFLDDSGTLVFPKLLFLQLPLQLRVKDFGSARRYGIFLLMVLYYDSYIQAFFSGKESQFIAHVAEHTKMGQSAMRFLEGRVQPGLNKLQRAADQGGLSLKLVQQAAEQKLHQLVRPSLLLLAAGSSQQFYQSLPTVFAADSQLSLLFQADKSIPILLIALIEQYLGIEAEGIRRTRNLMLGCKLLVVLLQNARAQEFKWVGVLLTRAGRVGLFGTVAERLVVQSAALSNWTQLCRHLYSIEGLSSQFMYLLNAKLLISKAYYTAALRMSKALRQRLVGWQLAELEGRQRVQFLIRQLQDRSNESKAVVLLKYVNSFNELLPGLMGAIGSRLTMERVFSRAHDELSCAVYRELMWTVGRYGQQYEKGEEPLLLRTREDFVGHLLGLIQEQRYSTRLSVASLENAETNLRRLAKSEVCGSSQGSRSFLQSLQIPAQFSFGSWLVQLAVEARVSPAIIQTLQAGLQIIRQNENLLRLAPSLLLLVMKSRAEAVAGVTAKIKFMLSDSNYHRLLAVNILGAFKYFCQNGLLQEEIRALVYKLANAISHKEMAAACASVNQFVQAIYYMEKHLLRAGRTQQDVAQLKRLYGKVDSRIGGQSQSLIDQEITQLLGCQDLEPRWLKSWLAKVQGKILLQICVSKGRTKVQLCRLIVVVYLINDAFRFSTCPPKFRFDLPPLVAQCLAHVLSFAVQKDCLEAVLTRHCIQLCKSQNKEALAKLLPKLQTSEAVRLMRARLLLWQHRYLPALEEINQQFEQLQEQRLVLTVQIKLKSKKFTEAKVYNQVKNGVGGQLPLVQLRLAQLLRDNPELSADPSWHQAYLQHLSKSELGFRETIGSYLDSRVKISSETHAIMRELIARTSPATINASIKDLVLRVKVDDPDKRSFISLAMYKLALAAPLISVWWLVPLLLSHSSSQQSVADVVLARLKTNQVAFSIITKAKSYLESFAQFVTKKEHATAFNFPDSLLHPPQGVLIVPTAEQLNTLDSDPTFITSLGRRGQVMSSKERPIKVTMTVRRGRDEGGVSFLVKTQNNRLESRANQYFMWMMRQVFEQQDTLGQFEVIALTPLISLHQWIHGSNTLQNIVIAEEQRRGIRRNSVNEKAIAPVLGQLLLEREPADWWQSTLNYNSSVAAWTVAGYLIGLGDRHSQNIVIRREAFTMHHIDFGLLFDAGIHLGTPEIVPARLTRNVVSGLGALGTEGLFRVTLEELWGRVQRHRPAIESSLRCILNEFKGRENARLMRTVQEKLQGDAKEKADYLIQSSVDQLSLVKMFSGWKAYI